MIKYNNNNINNNCRYNNGATAVDATAVDATAAIVVIFPYAVAVLCAFKLYKQFFYFMINRAKKSKQSKHAQFSMY